MKQSFSDITVLSNNLTNLFWFVGILAFGFLIKTIVSRFLSKILFKILQKNSTQAAARKFTELLHRPIGFLILLGFFYAAIQHLNFPEYFATDSVDGMGLKNVLKKTFSTVIAISITWGILRLVDFIGYGLLKKAEQTEGESDDQLVQFFTEAAKIVLVIISFLFILGSVYKLNISSLVAGLGIGGLAFALAAKESLENLLGSFTIFLDRPFIKGDLITVEDVTGVIEKVGFRSTRIRTLEKSYVTVPNKIMVNAKLNNLTERTLRRVDFTIGLIYSSTKEQISEIVNEIKDYLDALEFIEEQPVVRFSEFGASSLDVRILFYLKSTDWQLYVDSRQEINFKIMDIVKKHGSDFAFPTRTVYLQQN